MFYHRGHNSEDGSKGLLRPNEFIDRDHRMASVIWICCAIHRYKRVAKFWRSGIENGVLWKSSIIDPASSEAFAQPSAHFSVETQEAQYELL